MPPRTRHPAPRRRPCHPPSRRSAEGGSPGEHRIPTDPGAEQARQASARTGRIGMPLRPPSRHRTRYIQHGRARWTHTRRPPRQTLGQGAMLEAGTAPVSQRGGQFCDADAAAARTEAAGRRASESGQPPDPSPAASPDRSRSAARRCSPTPQIRSARPRQSGTGGRCTTASCSPATRTATCPSRPFRTHPDQRSLPARSSEITCNGAATARGRQDRQPHPAGDKHARPGPIHRFERRACQCGAVAARLHFITDTSANVPGARLLRSPVSEQPIERSHRAARWCRSRQAWRAAGGSTRRRVVAPSARRTPAVNTVARLDLRLLHLA